MQDQFSRTRLLFGPEGMEKLKNSHVAVFGIGGVGGYTVEALARSGIGVLDLVEPLKVWSVLDNGETQRLFISALPLDAAYDGSLHIVAILYADGRCEVIDYSCYGAG